MQKPLAWSLRSASAAAGAILLLLSSPTDLPAQSAPAANQLLTRDDLTSKKWDFRSTALPGKVFTGIWVFNPDKTMSKGTGAPSAWSIRGKKLRVDHENKNWQEFSLEIQSSKDGALVIKEVDSSAGKRDGITLTQRKG